MISQRVVTFKALKQEEIPAFLYVKINDRETKEVFR